MLSLDSVMSSWCQVSWRWRVVRFYSYWYELLQHLWHYSCKLLNVDWRAQVRGWFCCSGLWSRERGWNQELTPVWPEKDENWVASSRKKSPDVVLNYASVPTRWSDAFRLKYWCTPMQKKKQNSSPCVRFNFFFKA